MKLALIEVWERPIWTEWILTDDYGNIVGVCDTEVDREFYYIPQLVVISSERATWLLGLTNRAE